MYFASVVVLSGLILAFYMTAFRNTVFGVSLKSGNFLGLFHLLNLSVYTLPAILALNYFPIEVFWVAFKVQDHTVGWISLLLLASYFLYLLAIKMISLTSSRYFAFKRAQINRNEAAIYRRFVWASVLLLAVLVMFAAVVLNARNSFSLALIDGANLSAQRLSQGENTLTSLIKFMCILVPKFLIAIVACGAFEKRWAQKAVLVALLVYFSGLAGNKAPVIELFMIYFLVSVTVSGRSFQVVDTLKFLALMTSLIYLIFLIVSLQYSYIDNAGLFFAYFLQRTFVAQTIGFYEQFNLHLQSASYLWHAVPFASFFVDFPVFHKDLMLYSEDRFDPSMIGIKNTFFVAEAYGMGGGFFIIPSIFIYAINYCVSFVFVITAFNRLLTHNLQMNKLIAAAGLFSFLNVTGGFSELMLFKVTIMIIIIMSPFIFASLLARMRIHRA